MHLSSPKEICRLTGIRCSRAWDWKRNRETKSNTNHTWNICIQILQNKWEYSLTSAEWMLGFLLSKQVKVYLIYYATRGNHFFWIFDSLICVAIFTFIWGLAEWKKWRNGFGRSYTSRTKLFWGISFERTKKRLNEWIMQGADVGMSILKIFLTKRFHDNMNVCQRT